MLAQILLPHLVFLIATHTHHFSDSIPAEVPQILINKERLRNLNFDVELLGDCDTIVGELCRRLGEEWAELATSELMVQVLRDELTTPPMSPSQENENTDIKDVSMESESESKLLDNQTASVKDSSKTDSELNSTSNKTDKPNQGSISKDTSNNTSDNDNKTTSLDIADKSSINTADISKAESSDSKPESESHIPDSVDKSELSSSSEKIGESSETADSTSESKDKVESERGKENGLDEPTVGTSNSDSQSSVPREVARSWWQPAKFNLANRLEGNVWCFNI